MDKIKICNYCFANKGVLNKEQCSTIQKSYYQSILWTDEMTGIV